MQYPASLAPGGRGSWDYAYLDSAVGVPSTAQRLQRADLTGDISHLSADNTYPQYGERTTRV
jgi:hypothetical protein